MMERFRKKWSVADLTKLHRLVARDATPSEMKDEFPGRTLHAIRAMAYQRTPYQQIHKARNEARKHQQNQWTIEDDAKLSALRDEKMLLKNIAIKLNRTTEAVSARLKLLRDKSQSLKTPSRRARPCMCCRNDFMSDGPHHRMCGNCRSQSVGPYDI